MIGIFDDAPAQLATLATTAYAMLLGGVIGFERELKDRPAGFRTHMLVAGAAALLVGLGDLLAVRYADESYRAMVRVDPLRLVEAVVAAVGFLGAGAIFRRSGGNAIAGLTTAASLLMVAAIGIAVGLHAHLLAFGATALTLLVLLVLARIERRARRDG
ncbi:MgtC/SapB family protein [Luteimonas mephitis]|jgi:putative Mg2+ transporter-C (MgtC) family protein|uniref:MgtC/SapB family protein n=1 Tax=Luteimonas mephitis TaxID=83615 RepID=UPI0003F7FCFC|nr:MgtC/SapB family protein [Luteimonas mephitis]